jgi:UDP-N-acetylmuramoylalanine--D-glutamate ligase
MELVRKIGKLSFINDTTATTPDASISALSAFKGTVVLIAGGSDKKLNYAGLAKSIKESVVRVYMLPGSASEKILIQLKKLGYKDIFFAQSMKQAVRQAFAYANTNTVGTILLSPGAASFGLFLNEFDRGDQFTSQVNKLTA